MKNKRIFFIFNYLTGSLLTAVQAFVDCVRIDQVALAEWTRKKAV